MEKTPNSGGKLEEKWADKVFHFPTGEITITVEAKEIGNERRQELFEDIREFRGNKPGTYFFGTRRLNLFVIKITLLP